MNSAINQNTRHIKAFFQNENSFVLLKLSARCALSELFEFELTLLQPDSSKPVDPAQVIGLGVSVQIEMPNETKPREYYGCVSELRQERWTKDGVYFVAKMVPALWFLTQRKNCRIFQEKDTKQIVEEVLRDAGINDFDFRLSGQYAKREYCVQYRESDFNFISRLLEEEGVFYYFKHADGIHSIIFCDADSHFYNLDVSTIHFPKPGDTLLNRHEILDWQERFQFIPGSVAQKDFNFKEPYTTSLLQRRTSGVQLPNNDACEVYDYHGRYFDESNGLHLTKVRMGEIEKDYETGVAVSNLAFIHPGGKFKFGKHRMPNRRGQEYAVTAVEFSARTGSYATGTEDETEGEDDSEAYFENRFTCIPADRVFRPSRRAVRPFVQGLQTAIVTTNGDEIMVDEHGRVKVHFHWDRYNQFDDKSSCWIRVSQVHAGEGFGMMDIPRRNEEVIVSFIEGDPDRPIITGRVYNGANRPPYDLKPGNNGKNKTRRGNATKSIGKDTASYNEMTMDDTPGEEQVRIHGQYDMNTTVENDQTNTVNNNRTKTIAVNETNSIGVDQAEDVGNNRTTSIGVNDSETVGVNQSVSVGTNQSNSVGSMQTNNVGTIQNEMIGIVANQMVGAAKAVTVGAVLNTAVGLSSTEQVGIMKSTMVGSTYKISAGSKIEISCGASKLTMDAGGKITLSGTQISISASGPVKINGAIIDLN